MINLLRYWKHLLCAKGRHGTHSPFVYAFVEQVLRDKSRIGIHKTNPSEKDTLSGLEINLLYKTIKFLQPSIILADKDLIDLIGQIRTLSQWNDIVIQELNEHNIKKEKGNDVLVVSRNDKNRNVVLQQLIKQHIVTLLLIKPHRDSASQKIWNLLCGLPEVNMKLDFWHFGLLLNHPGFKASQYFKLR